MDDQLHAGRSVRRRRRRPVRMMLIDWSSGRMNAQLTATDRAHLAEAAEEGAAVSPNRLRRRRDRPRPRGDRRGLPRRPRRAARRAGGARGLSIAWRGPLGSDDIRDRRALRAPGSPAALHRGDPRGGHLQVVGSEDPTEKASGRGPGILRDGGVEVEFAPRRGDRRPPSQPGPPQHQDGLPLVTLKLAMSLDGATATAPVTHPGSPASAAASWSTAGGPNPMRSRSDRNRPRRRPASDRPHRGRPAPAAPRRLRPIDPASPRLTASPHDDSHPCSSSPRRRPPRRCSA